MRIMITLLVLSLIGCGDDDGSKNTSNSTNPNSSNPNSTNPNSSNPNSTNPNSTNSSNNNEEPTEWELEPTDFHPRISGTLAHLSDESTLELSESKPEGWRIEVQANKALTVGLHAFGNTDTELGMVLEHPDGTCEIPMSASNAAIQLNIQAVEDADVWGSVVFTTECFGAPEPITFYLGFGSGEFPGL